MKKLSGVVTSHHTQISALGGLGGVNCQQHNYKKRWKKIEEKSYLTIAY